jgi:hypothetical protein
VPTLTTESVFKATLDDGFSHAKLQAGVRGTAIRTLCPHTTE